MSPRDDESFASLFEKSATARTGDRRYHVGESVEVTIVAVGREAVFADLGRKQEGIFERTDLAEEDGTLRVEVGSRVTAVVSAIDFATGQVRLSPVVVRRTQDDPGTTVTATATSSSGPVLAEGARVKGKVTGIERYGVFVQISGTQGRNGRGLVPVQETGTPRGADLKKHFTAGQDVEAKILSIDESGKIRLSFSAIQGDDEHRVYEAFKSGQRAEGAPREAEAQAPAKTSKKSGKPEPKNFGTLGDLLSKKKP